MHINSHVQLVRVAHHGILHTPKYFSIQNGMQYNSNQYLTNPCLGNTKHLNTHGLHHTHASVFNASVHVQRLLDSCRTTAKHFAIMQRTKIFESARQRQQPDQKSVMRFTERDKLRLILIVQCLFSQSPSNKTQDTQSADIEHSQASAWEFCARVLTQDAYQRPRAEVFLFYTPLGHITWRMVSFQTILCIILKNVVSGINQGST